MRCCENVLQPRIIERALDLALEQLADDTGAGTQREALAKQLQRVEGELVNLSETAARGGAVPAILEALTRRDADRRRLTSELAALDRRLVWRFDRAVVRKQLRSYLEDWGALLTENLPRSPPVARRRPGWRQNRIQTGC